VRCASVNWTELAQVSVPGVASRQMSQGRGD